MYSHIIIIAIGWKEMSVIKLIFVRHGEASDSWDNHPDPGLSKAGIDQANKLLQKKELNNLENYSFVSSPKLRAVETAKPLAKKFNKEIEIDKSFIEIPSNDVDINNRQSWIKDIMMTKKKDLPDFVKIWIDTIYRKTNAFKNNSIIFTHFMVINALISEITNSESLIYFNPGYTSIVKIEIKNKKIENFSIEESKKTYINV
tara:strand:- start:2762 stop:3367 length:606 start_codon:yes stop_codon:yes gene_type:complete